MTGAERAGLAGVWRDLHHNLARLTDAGEGMIRVGHADFDAMLRALRRDGHPLADDLELWRLEALKLRFERIGEQARLLAARLGKSPVRIEIDHGGVYTDSSTWAPFWAAFVHVVRNAIDHGFEEHTERARLSKGVATLTLRSYLRDTRLVFEFSDDGRGIAWDRVRERARAAGLPTHTRDDLVAALFHDGISTRSNAVETSGRGVGLGALADVCRAMGCEITVDSSPGVGTLFRFDLPSSYARTRRERSMVPAQASGVVTA